MEFLDFSTAFSVTDVDIQTVLAAMGWPCDDAAVEHWEARLDTGRAAKAALRADDLDEQSVLAHEDLRDQLMELTEAEREARARAEKTLSDPAVQSPLPASRRRVHP